MMLNYHQGFLATTNLHLYDLLKDLHVKLQVMSSFLVVSLHCLCNKSPNITSENIENKNKIGPN